MKKNLIYLLILVVLVAIAASVYLKKEEAELPVDDKNFRVENVEAITKIFMVNKEGDKATLTKDGESWMINNKFVAAPYKVDLLLETLKKQKVQQSVSDAAWDNVIKVIASQSTKVEVFTDNMDKAERVFFVGHEIKDGNATFMLMQIDGKRAKRPYIVHIPGFGGGLSSRYFIDELDWRDLTVFNHKVDEISEVSLTYTNQPENSYSLTIKGLNDYELKDNSGSVTEVNIPKTTAYLDGFENLNAEVYVNEHSKKDSLLATPPYCVVTVTDKSGGSKEVKIYRMPPNKRTKTLYDQRGDMVKYDPDRYFALINEGKDFVIIQDFVFNKVLRAHAEFVKPNS